MFDISFWELFISGVIALIVLGPERLPRAAKKVGLWVSKAKRSFNHIKQDIDYELQMEELKRQLEENKQAIEKQASLDSIEQELSVEKELLEGKELLEHKELLEDKELLEAKQKIQAFSQKQQESSLKSTNQHE